MFVLFFALLLQAPIAAYAQPSPEIIKMIEDSYNPMITANETPLEESRDCRISELKILAMDAVLRDESTIIVKVYTPKSKNALDRTVIILPPISGENMLDRGYANTFCSAGLRATLVQSWTHNEDYAIDLGSHDRGALRALASVRHLVDYLNPTRPNQVGILGTSLGGITGSLVIGYENRINVATFIVAGIHLPEIIAFSTEKRTTKLREERMKEYRFGSTEDYLEALKNSVKIEPADFTNFTGPKKLLTFVATNDSTVPTKNQRDLVSAFGSESIDYAGNHVGTIIRISISEKGRIQDFFLNNLQ